MLSGTGTWLKTFLSTETDKSFCEKVFYGYYQYNNEHETKDCGAVLHSSSRELLSPLHPAGVHGSWTFGAQVTILTALFSLCLTDIVALNPAYVPFTSSPPPPLPNLLPPPPPPPPPPPDPLTDPLSPNVKRIEG